METCGPPFPNYFAESNAKFELTAVHVRSGNIGAQSSWTSSIGSQVNACICMRRVCNARRRMAVVHARVEPADRPNYDNRRQIVRNAKQAWLRSVNYN